MRSKRRIRRLVSRSLGGAREREAQGETEKRFKEKKK